MRGSLAAGIVPALMAAGLIHGFGCTDGSTPATPPPAPVPPAPVSPAPPVPETPDPCTGVGLQVVFLERSNAGLARGELTLDAAEPDVGLDFVSPYTIQIPDGGANLDIPGLRPTVGVFVSNLAFTPLGDGFRQTMTLEWISELEVRAGRPHCEPVAVSCDLGGCAGP